MTKGLSGPLSLMWFALALALLARLGSTGFRLGAQVAGPSLDASLSGAWVCLTNSPAARMPTS